MLSDRAPGVLETVFGEDAQRLWERVDASERAQALQEQAPQLAERADAGPDFLIHVAVWAVVMLLIALAVWSWSGLTLAAVATFAGSVAVELAQGRYSDTRAVQEGDVLANGLGVAAGAAVAALLYMAWSALGVSLGALFRR